jgi:hypothetical protein
MVDLMWFDLGNWKKGRMLLGPNPASQLVFKWHNYIRFFMDVRLSAGMASAFTWFSLCLQLLKQYFWRNHLGHMLLFSFHFGCLMVRLLAKFVANVL